MAAQPKLGLLPVRNIRTGPGDRVGVGAAGTDLGGIRRRFEMATTEHGRTVLNAQEARQGKELGVMRYVLHISLALSVIAGVVLYAIFFG